MADQAGATTPKKGINKMEAVRQALGHFGSDAKPSAMRPWIKQQFGIDMSTDHISTYKGDIRRKQAGKAKAPTPAPKAAAAASAATPKPAASAAKKPTASKPAPKKPAAPRPQAQPAASRSNALPKGSSAERGISLDDVQTVKALVGRVGAEQLRSLIDLLTK